MRVVLLGVAYGALLGVVFATMFGVAIAVAVLPLGFVLPHNLAGLTMTQMILNTALIGLWAGALGGALLGLLIQVAAPGRVARGRWLGAVAAILPLVWLPFFAARGLLRHETITMVDIVGFVLMVLLPLAAAITAGTLIGGRLARSAA